MKKLCLGVIALVALGLMGCGDGIDYKQTREQKGHLISISETYLNQNEVKVVRLVWETPLMINTSLGFWPHEAIQFRKWEVYPVEKIPSELIGKNVEQLTRIKYRIVSRGYGQALPLLYIMEFYEGVSP